MAMLQSFYYWIADLLRPWHDNGLPEELQYSEVQDELAIRGHMLRLAGLSVAQDLAFGVFGIMGVEYARRALRAWRSREILIMEDLSIAYMTLAWDPERQKRLSSPSIPPIRLDRLVETLFIYFDYLGESRTREAIRGLVDRHLKEDLTEPCEELGNETELP